MQNRKMLSEMKAEYDKEEMLLEFIAATRAFLWLFLTIKKLWIWLHQKMSRCMEFAGCGDTA